MFAATTPCQLAPACPVTLKSLADYYEQKTRLHRLAFGLAERRGLKGDLSKRLFYLLLLCQKYEARLREQLRAAGRPLDTKGSELVALAQQGFRERHGITCLRPAPLEHIQALGFTNYIEADLHALWNARGTLTPLFAAGSILVGTPAEYRAGGEVS